MTASALYLRVLIALVAVLLVSAAKHTHQITGKVVSIADGDSLTVLDETKTQHKIRLEGIDAPESGQAFGTKAKEALAEKVFEKNVVIEWAETDKYGRVLGDIYIDDRLINLEMVEDGWAWHFKKYSKSKDLAEAETKAKAAARGLWADKSPVAPWDFRHPTFDSTSDSDPKTTTVYVTEGGTKYHNDGCRHLAKSKIAKTLEDAKKGYSPCSVCNAPK